MLRRHLPTAAVAIALTALVVVAPVAGARQSSSTTGSALTGSVVAHVGGQYTVYGTGFSPGALVPLEIAEAGGCCIALNMVADAYGSFAYTGEVWAPGTYEVRAFAKRNARWRVAASWSFEAY